MSAYFVTAAGTDIGKTFVTAGLIATLRQRGHVVEALKPIASGFDAASMVTTDPGQLLTALGRDITEENIARIAPWRFEALLSPDMAAAREGRTIDFAALTAFTAEAMAECKGILFIEGVGGIMVPLFGSFTTLDWMAELKAPLIMVGGSYLGSMSHTLSAVEVATRRGLRIAALVINESADSPVRLNETAQTLERYTTLPIFSMPRGAAAGHPAFERLADAIVA